MPVRASCKNEERERERERERRSHKCAKYRSSIDLDRGGTYHSRRQQHSRDALRELFTFFFESLDNSAFAIFRMYENNTRIKYAKRRNRKKNKVPMKGHFVRASPDGHLNFRQLQQRIRAFEHHRELFSVDRTTRAVVRFFLLISPGSPLRRCSII
jgi:hypothetical protein